MNDKDILIITVFSFIPSLGLFLTLLGFTDNLIGSLGISIICWFSLFLLLGINLIKSESKINE